MRLIDADKIDFNEVFVGASDFAQDTRNAAQMLIDAQPTAYSVDKVVEEIEAYGNNTDVSISKENVIGIVIQGGLGPIKQYKTKRQSNKMEQYFIKESAI